MDTHINIAHCDKWIMFNETKTSEFYHPSPNDNMTATMAEALLQTSLYWSRLSPAWFRRIVKRSVCRAHESVKSSCTILPYLIAVTHSSLASGAVLASKCIRLGVTRYRITLVVVRYDRVGCDNGDSALCGIKRKRARHKDIAVLCLNCELDGHKSFY